MKIALFYSGSVRNLIETIENNINYFDPLLNNIDLYFSIWSHVGYVDNINSADYILSNRIIDANTLLTEEFIKSFVPKNVCIKKIKIEKYNKDNYNLYLINGANKNLAAQYYKIHDCFNLIDDLEQYDILARMRCDIILNNQIDLNLMYELVLDNKIIFPNKIWYNYIKTLDITSINEMTWISNKKIMQKTCNIYNNADKINEIINLKNQTLENYGENICHMNLEAEQIIENIFLFDFDYQILR